MRKLFQVSAVWVGLVNSLMLLSSSAQASTLTHFGTVSDWAKAIKSLEGGVPQNVASQLGVIQTGPYTETTWLGRRSIVMTMINGGQCHLLRKPVEELDHPLSPTTVENFDCGDGRGNRVGAVIPNFSGYSPISNAGLTIFRGLREKLWGKSSECFLNDSQTSKVPFLQILNLGLFEMSNEPTQFDVYSWANAFSTRYTTVMNEWRINPVQIQRFLEQRLPSGGYRYLIWAGRFNSPTDFENRMQIAVVNRELMSGSGDQTLRLFAGDRICSGDHCRSISNFSFTEYLSFQYVTIDYNPSDPSAPLNLRLYEVDADHPTMDLTYVPFSGPNPIPLSGN